MDIIEWPAFKIVPTKQFFVDHDYQRPETSLAADIAADFQPFLFSSVVANLRDKRKRGKNGSLALIDGQQRWIGASGAKVPEVPAIVFEGLTVSQEAWVFTEILIKRRAIASHDRFKAQTVSGEHYPAQVAIKGVVEGIGLKVGSAQASKSDNTVIAAAGALETVYAWGSGATHKDLGGGDVERGAGFLYNVLTVIQEAWPARPPQYLSRNIILGVGNFMTREFAGGGTVDRETLVKKLRTTDPEKLGKAARDIQRRTGGSGVLAKWYADAVQRVYIR